MRAITLMPSVMNSRQTQHIAKVAVAVELQRQPTPEEVATKHEELFPGARQGGATPVVGVDQTKNT